MNVYVGPTGFGANPERGGTLETGMNRIQSLKPLSGRLTKQIKEQVTKDFTYYGVDVKKIDKTSKGFIRVAYNGTLHWWEED